MPLLIFVSFFAGTVVRETVERIPSPASGVPGLDCKVCSVHTMWIREPTYQGFSTALMVSFSMARNSGSFRCTAAEARRPISSITCIILFWPTKRCTASHRLEAFLSCSIHHVLRFCPNQISYYFG